jgi:hypothetical protein
MITAVRIPFPAEYFDRFEAGKTILYLEFAREGEIRPARHGEESQRGLLSYEAVGIYMGRQADETVIIDAGLERPCYLMPAGITGVKEIAPKKLSEIVGALQDTLEESFDEGAEDSSSAVRFVNRLRSFVDQHPLLVPRHKLL